MTTWTGSQLASGYQWLLAMSWVGRENWKNGRPTPATWPNIGIGRSNPDGSKVSCTACHSRHTFSPVVAASPTVPENVIWDLTIHKMKYMNPPNMASLSKLLRNT